MVHTIKKSISEKVVDVIREDPLAKPLFADQKDDTNLENTNAVDTVWVDEDA